MVSKIIRTALVEQQWYNIRFILLAALGSCMVSVTSGAIFSLAASARRIRPAQSSRTLDSRGLGQQKPQALPFHSSKIAVSRSQEEEWEGDGTNQSGPWGAEGPFSGSHCPGAWCPDAPPCQMSVRPLSVVDPHIQLISGNSEVLRMPGDLRR